MSREILKEYCGKYDVMLDDLLSNKRTKKLVTVRTIIALDLRNKGWSYPQIAKILNRHHTSIMYYTGDIVKNT
jgi:chromosomal replication initiation ATPase DnaA